MGCWRRQAQNNEFEEMIKTVTADSFNKQRRNQMEKDSHVATMKGRMSMAVIERVACQDNENEKRMAMRKGLDEQMALIEERAREARLQDLMEGAEIKVGLNHSKADLSSGHLMMNVESDGSVKARSIQQLCEDLEAQKKRREAKGQLCGTKCRR